MGKTNLRRLVLCAFLASACLLVQGAHAIEFPEIKADQLKAKMASGEKLLLVNPLSLDDYLAKHIPGSVNIPLQSMQSSEKLPNDKGQLIVTYCLGRE